MINYPGPYPQMCLGLKHVHDRKILHRRVVRAGVGVGGWKVGALYNVLPVHRPWQ